jgi:hypothetical protein
MRSVQMYQQNFLHMYAYVDVTQADNKCMTNLSICYSLFLTLEPGS